MNVGRLLAERCRFIKSSEVREILKWITDEVISFGGGIPDPKSFPISEIQEIVSEVLSSRPEASLQYSVTEGIPELRREIVKFMRSRDIDIKSENEVLITVGSQEAIDLIGKIFIEPGDIIITEKPTYLAALQVFKTYEARVVGISMDSDGMITQELEDTVKKLVSNGEKIKFIYTVPTCQNPTGISMSMDRRKHLLEIASKYDLLIIEDDPYSYLIYENVNFKHLKALDSDGRVIYLSTFSKIIAPGLRVGWVVSNEEITKWLALAKQETTLHASTLSQYIAYEFLRRGLVHKHVPRIVNLYKTKRDIMLKALEEHMPNIVEWTRPIGGMFIWLTLSKDNIDTANLLEIAIKKYKVAYVPGKTFYPDHDVKNSMRLNFTYPSIDQIYDGIKRLGKLIREEVTV